MDGSFRSSQSIHETLTRVSLSPSSLSVVRKTSSFHLFRRRQSLSLSPPPPTVSKMTMKWTRRVPSHSLIRSLVRSLRCALSFSRCAALSRSLSPLTHSLPSSCHGKVVYIFGMNASFSYTFGPLCAHPSDQFCLE